MSENNHHGHIVISSQHPTFLEVTHRQVQPSTHRVECNWTLEVKQHISSIHHFWIMPFEDFVKLSKWENVQKGSFTFTLTELVTNNGYDLFETFYNTSNYFLGYDTVKTSPHIRMVFKCNWNCSVFFVNTFRYQMIIQPQTNINSRNSTESMHMNKTKVSMH